MNWPRLVIPVFCLCIWQVSSFMGILPEYKLPSPVQILNGLESLITIGMPPGHPLHWHILSSLHRVVIGFFSAILIALPLGLTMGWSKAIRQILEPIFEFIRPIPPLAWIPIAILWFGIGIKSAAFIIFLGAFFPILLNTIYGVRRIDPILIDAARTLNASSSAIFTKVLLPGAVPSIITGIRIGIGISWMTLIAAEFTGVKSGYGLGYMIMTARDIQRPDLIMAGMLVFGSIGFSVDFVLRLIERKIVRWR